MSYQQVPTSDDKQPVYQPQEPLVSPQYEASQSPPQPPQYYGTPVYQGPPPGSQPVYQAYPAPVAPVPISFGELEQRYDCQFCGYQGVTQIRHEAGTFTYLVAGGLVLVGCFLGCCLIPFFTDGCKDVVHICPSCHRVVGRKNRV